MGNVFPLVNLDSIFAFYLFEDNKFIHILSRIPCLSALERQLLQKQEGNGLILDNHSLPC